MICNSAFTIIVRHVIQFDCLSSNAFAHQYFSVSRFMYALYVCSGEIRYGKIFASHQALSQNKGMLVDVNADTKRMGTKQALNEMR